VKNYELKQNTATPAQIYLPKLTSTNSAAKDWMNLKQVDVWIRKSSFLPSPSVEWSDKEMGSADHSFASDMAFSSRLSGRKSSAAWLWLLRAYLHEGTPFVLFSSVSVWVCVCLVKKATWSHSSLTLRFHPTWQPTKPAYSAIKIRVSTQTLKTKR